MKNLGKIRAVSIEDEPWFIGKDIVNALGYEINKTTSYTKYINQYCSQEDIKKVNNSTAELFGMKDAGRKGEILINEYALYDLVLDSPLPSAKAFKKWVTHEVLPQIRQTGGYIPINGDEDDATIMAKALLIAQKTIEKKDKLITELQPKADKYKQFMDTDGTFEFRELCKHLNGLGYNLKETELRTILKDNNIICKQGRKYVITQEGVRSGYGLLRDNLVDNKNRPATRYTEKLRDYLIGKLA